MAEEELKKGLEAAISAQEPFGPADEDEPMPEVPATTLREVLLSQPNQEDGEVRLWLRRVRIVGVFDLEARRIRPRLRFEHCDFAEAIELQQTSGSDIALLDCHLHGSLLADQLDLRWNLLLDRSTFENGISLAAAKIGGSSR